METRNIAGILRNPKWTYPKSYNIITGPGMKSGGGLRKKILEKYAFGVSGQALTKEVKAFIIQVALLYHFT